jgi:lipopolysaccharide export system protein LptC
MKLLQINTTACDGSDVFWTWILWLLAAFILGVLLGWLLKQIFGTSIGTAEPDLKQDLTKVEGIGPKIEGLLNKKGIKSYRQLSNASHSFLEQMIVDAGPAFTTHRGMTNTWPAQAKLAELGEWDELKKCGNLLVQAS